MREEGEEISWFWVDDLPQAEDLKNFIINQCMPSTLENKNLVEKNF